MEGAIWKPEDGECIQFKKLSETAIIPTRATPYSAGFDLYADEDVTITTGSHLVKTNIAVAIPPGHYGRIAMRSGLAVKKNLSVSAGVIDRDYRGGIGVVVYCTLSGGHKIQKGERFAQLIIEACSYAHAIEVKELDNLHTHVGFGSTGSM